MNAPTNYWSSSPLPHPVQWPQWRYHATKAAVRVRSDEEAAALGEGWSDKYIPAAYPKMKFRPKATPKEGEPPYETVVVDTPEDEQKLAGAGSEARPARAG